MSASVRLDKAAVAFTVPLVPPSVNHYVKHTRSGRHYVTKEAIAFKEAVAIFAKNQSVRGDRYTVVIGIFLGAGQRGDLDNFGKCAIDSLVAAGVIDSDAKIDALMLLKDRDHENPRTEFSISTKRVD